MNYGKIAFHLMIIMFSFVICNHAMGGKLYKWVDENGVVHFSDRLPDTHEHLTGSIQEGETKDILPTQPKTLPNVESRQQNPIAHTTDCSFTIQGSRNLGTGFFISSNGYAITCKHVLEEDRDFIAILNDKNTFPISIISKSRNHDLALVLVITSRETPYLKLRDPKTLIPGERVFAVGSSVGLQATVTDGVFTGLRDREDKGDKVIQFSAPINPGNSGGPLIDYEGNVVGVVSLKYAMQDGLPVAGVGFAIPSEYVLKEYSAYGHK